MEPVKQYNSYKSITDSTFDQFIDGWYSHPTESPREDQNKQNLVNLTPELQLPSTPANNNVDPIKYSPPDPTPQPRMSTMSEL